MEMQNAQKFDWAHDAYVVLHDSNSSQPAEKWPARQNNTSSIPPSLLTQIAIERFGQVTPPDEMSPADPPRNAREASIPVEQLRNEAVWHQQQTRPQYDPESCQKRRRTSRQTAASQTQPEPAALPQHDDANPPPPKRKRGRPKSQPQMVEAVTAEGFPFQVSSARQSHLEKNRVAAHKCRQRKKEYINGLEGRAREFSSKNKALKENVAMLREEVLSLKNEVLRHAGCGFWAVDEYLARCAGDLLGMEAPLQAPNRYSMTQQSPTMDMQQLKAQRHDSTDFMPSHVTDTSSPNMKDDFGGLELLRDYDDDNVDEEH
ncbi:hypothetical protein BDU57DRAFT_515635 [Ampelomyces quisqualis]|uniref:BZIP domain-containing protein n=1 Tax=Ampelomyces quisqualis TaxID=50730 RepID=A0A6A5QLU6_AMPQU|nr:hypothetical protein BDU57DRAFT_515635 [Ampelomyces quisqualis]